MKNELKKYSQKLNLIMGVLGAVTASLPLVQDDLGSYYGVVMTISAAASAYCVAKRQNLNAP